MQNKIKAQEELNSQEDDSDFLSNFTVPVAAAIIGGVAASWGFIQAQWHGHCFKKLIVRVLGEIEPTDTGKHNNLKSYMEKEFIHKDIICNPTENTDYIFSIDPLLVYHTRQLSSAFGYEASYQEIVRTSITYVESEFKRPRI